MRTALLSLIFSVALSSAALAAPAASDAWVRWVPGQKNAAGYVTLTNKTAKADALVGAESIRFKTVELHEMAMDGDRMLMRKVEHVEIPAHGKAELAPMGYHLMLFGMQGDAGETVPLTLHFASGEKLDVAFELRSVGKTSSHGHHE